MSSPENTPSLAPVQSEDEHFRSAIVAAQQGNRAMRPLVREYLSKHPGAILALGGDLAWQSIARQITIHVGKDYAAGEALSFQLEKIRQDLLGPAEEPSALVRLLIDRVVANWLHLHSLEYSYASQKDPTITLEVCCQQMISMAQRRYLASIEALARIRRLELPAVQINVAEQQVNIAGNLNAAAPAA